MIKKERGGVRAIVDHAIYSIDFVEYTGGGCGVQVDQVVCNVATTLIEKVSNVQVGVTQYIQDMAQGARCVAVGDSEP